MHSCISCVHCSVILLADTPSIGVTRVVLCMTGSFLFPELGLHCGFVFRVRPWFMPIVTHISTYPFYALLSDPCPTVVLVSNGLGHRSPRTRRIWSIRRSDPTRETW